MDNIKEYSIIQKNKNQKNYQYGFWKKFTDMNNCLEELELYKYNDFKLYSKGKKLNDFSIAFMTYDYKTLILGIDV